MFSLIVFSPSAEADFLSNKSDDKKIITSISYLESGLDINEIKNTKEKWIYQEIDKINFGFSEKTYWIKLGLKNSHFNKDWFLTINNTRIDYISFYFFSGFNDKEFHSGDYTDIEGQLSAYPTFNFELKKDYKANIYIKVKSDSQIDFQPIVRNGIEYGKYSEKRYYFHLIYFFIFIVFIASQTINLISGYDKMVFYYTAFLIFSFSYLFLYYGDGNLILWPKNIYLKNSLFFVSASLALLFFICFMKEYLRSEEFFPKFNRILNFYIIFSLVSTFVILLPSSNFVRSVLLITEGTLACFISIAGVKVSLKGRKRWSLLFATPLIFSNVSVLIYQATFLGIFPHTDLTSKILLWSLPIDIFLISIGFVYRHLLLKEENEKLMVRLHEISNAQVSLSINGVEEIMLLEKPKQNTRLGNIDKESIVSKLTLYLDSERAFLEPRLTLEQVASNLQIRSDQLSAIINSQLNTSFSTLINLKRLEEATILLMTSPNKSILDISLECGFGSKSSFNRLFKQQFGTTPTEYRKMRKMEDRSAFHKTAS
ncbi:MAG: helix-turn-helix domain-containing protein [Marinomonas sp.]